MCFYRAYAQKPEIEFFTAHEFNIAFPWGEVLEKYFNIMNPVHEHEDPRVATEQGQFIANTDELSDSNTLAVKQKSERYLINGKEAPFPKLSELSGNPWF